LAVKTASEMTYTVSGGALNAAQPTKDQTGKDKAKAKGLECQGQGLGSQGQGLGSQGQGPGNCP